ncbi:MAG: 3-isopropylmalate dehydratase small subunit, partial [Ginsengibacter sp.]
GLLPLQVSEDFLQKIFQLGKDSKLSIDVDKQTVTIDATGAQETFDINSYKKTCLLNGYDDIDYLINSKEEIEAFEATLT